jgi:hypothetical protein
MNYLFSRQKHERPLPASDEPLGHLDADQGEEGHQHRKGEIQHDLNISAVKLVIFGNPFRCGHSSSCEQWALFCTEFDSQAEVTINTTNSLSGSLWQYTSKW